MLCSETTAVEFLQSRVSSMISAIQAAMAIRLYGKYDELRREQPVSQACATTLDAGSRKRPDAIRFLAVVTFF